MIKVYFDTNMLEDYSGNNVIISNKILSEKFYNFIKQVSENASLYSAMTIVIPQIVIDEIRQHLRESIKNIKDYINKIADIYKFFKIEKCLNVANVYKETFDNFEKEINKLTSSYHFISVETHDNNLFHIYDRAVNKKPPFYAKNKKLDSGFKDMLLIKTALDNKNSADLIICTNDPDFCGTGTDIEIVKSFDNLTEKITSQNVSKEEKIKNIISQEYIKNRILDEVKIKEKDKKNTQIKLLSYFEIDDPQFENTEIIKLEIKVKRKIYIVEFYLDTPTNEIELYQIIE